MKASASKVSKVSSASKNVNVGILDDIDMKGMSHLTSFYSTSTTQQQLIIT